MKPILIDGEYTSKGVVATIYADSITDLQHDEYEGVEKTALACGSVAYDKSQNVYVLNSSGKWTADNGNAYNNYVKTFFVPMQRVTPNEVAPTYNFTLSMGLYGYYNPYAPISPNGYNVDFLFDGVEYKNVQKKLFMETFPYYGGDVSTDGTAFHVDFSQYPFVLLYDVGGTLSGLEGWFIIAETAGEHSFKVSGNDGFATLLDAELTLTTGVYMIIDDENYSASRSSYYGNTVYFAGSAGYSIIFCGGGDASSTLLRKIPSSDDSVEIGLYYYTEV